MQDLRRDVGQLLWFGFHGTEAPADLLDAIGAGDVGGIVLFKRNLIISGEAIELAPLVELNQALHAAAPDDAPLLIAVDQEGGRVQRVRAPATVWPPMLRLDRLEGAAAEALAEEIGLAMGTELRALGFDVDFAPVLDVHTNPANPVIGDRAFAAEPARAASRALAFARGLDAAGMVGCGKHFPGHGDTSTDSHLELPRLDHDIGRLRSVELAPFTAAAAASMPMIMTAHVVFSALEPSLPATLSPRVVTGLLRKDLGYRGVVVSDDLDMKAISSNYGAGEAATRAVAAGCDVLLCCNDPDTQRIAREALIREAQKSAELRRCVGDSAQRVRELKRAHFGRGLAASSLDVVGSAKHRALADRLARL